MPTDADPFTLARDEGHSVWFMGTLITVKVTAEDTGEAFSLIEQLAPPEYALPMHVHHEDDKLYYVLEGKLTIHREDESVHAPAGTSAFFPRGTPHTYRVEGDAPARLLVLVFGAGFEQFFVEAGEPADELVLPSMEQPTPEKLAARMDLASEHGFEIVGPRPH